MANTVNFADVAELTELGLMRPAGLLAFEQRRPEGASADLPLTSGDLYS